MDAPRGRLRQTGIVNQRSRLHSPLFRSGRSTVSVSSTATNDRDDDPIVRETPLYRNRRAFFGNDFDQTSVHTSEPNGRTGSITGSTVQGDENFHLETDSDTQTSVGNSSWDLPPLTAENIDKALSYGPLLSSFPQALAMSSDISDSLARMKLRKQEMEMAALVQKVQGQLQTMENVIRELQNEHAIKNQMLKKQIKETTRIKNERKQLKHELQEIKKLVAMRQQHTETKTPMTHLQSSLQAFMNHTESTQHLIMEQLKTMALRSPSSRRGSVENSQKIEDSVKSAMTEFSELQANMLKALENSRPVMEKKEDPKPKERAVVAPPVKVAPTSSSWKLAFVAMVGIWLLTLGAGAAQFIWGVDLLSYLDATTDGNTQSIVESVKETHREIHNLIAEENKLEDNVEPVYEAASTVELDNGAVAVEVAVDGDLTVDSFYNRTDNIAMDEAIVGDLDNLQDASEAITSVESMEDQVKDERVQDTDNDSIKEGTVEAEVSFGTEESTEEAEVSSAIEESNEEAEVSSVIEESNEEAIESEDDTEAEVDENDSQPNSFSDAEANNDQASVDFESEAVEQQESGELTEVNAEEEIANSVSLDSTNIQEKSNADEVIADAELNEKAPEVMTEEIPAEESELLENTISADEEIKPEGDSIDANTKDIEIGEIAIDEAPTSELPNELEEIAVESLVQADTITDAAAEDKSELDNVEPETTTEQSIDESADDAAIVEDSLVQNDEVPETKDAETQDETQSEVAEEINEVAAEELIEVPTTSEATSQDIEEPALEASTLENAEVIEESDIQTIEESAAADANDAENAEESVDISAEEATEDATGDDSTEVEPTPEESEEVLNTPEDEHSPRELSNDEDLADASSVDDLTSLTEVASVHEDEPTLNEETNESLSSTKEQVASVPDSPTEDSEEIPTTEVEALSPVESTLEKSTVEATSDNIHGATDELTESPPTNDEL